MLKKSRRDFLFLQPVADDDVMDDYIILCEFVIGSNFWIDLGFKFKFDFLSIFFGTYFFWTVSKNFFEKGGGRVGKENFRGVLGFFLKKLFRRLFPIWAEGMTLQSH